MSIVFALYALKVRGDSGATGGHISNFQLILDVAVNSDCVVIAPNLSRRAVDALERVGVRAVTSGFGEVGFWARVAKRKWIEDHLRSELLSGKVDSIFSSNGVSDLCHRSIRKYSPGVRHAIVTRAFEDLYYSQYSGGWSARTKSAIIDAVSWGGVARSYRAATLVVTNSEFMQSTICEYFRIPLERVHVLFPPVSTSSEVYRSPSKEMKVGMINPSVHKGERVMEMLAALRPDVHFRYFGSRDRTYAAPNIEFCGWKSDVNQIFAEIDLLLVPSRWHEPLGRAAIEAISQGRPVLVSNRGGLPEAVDPYFVVEDDSAATWSRALSRIINDEDGCRRAWQRSMDGLGRFSPSSHAAKVAQILQLVSNDP